ncbi:MAG: ComEC/Rec2 family competence protein [Ferruginibacter sp.]
MNRPYTIPFWKFAPFSRVLFPLVAGIIIQWYVSFHIFFILLCICCFSISYTLLRLFPIYLKYSTRLLQGLLLQFIMASVGMLATWNKDISNNKNWYGYHANDSSHLLLFIEEPLVEKTKSYKTTASVKLVVNQSETIPVKGKLLVYFSKDSGLAYPGYGDYILCNNNLQWIKNSGNPGGFNYERYAAFQGYYQQAFLQKNRWSMVSQNHGNLLYNYIFSTKENIIKIFKKYVTGKDELGIAEALLIGYKEDLDKDLVQAYSNAGVVHIIAISGMHLALIYFLLLWICNHSPYLKNKEAAKAMLVIIFLWMFSLLTGATASVLRSAVMFSFLVIGKLFFRNASIYNTLAASAFVLLIYNPHFLWDVGFQLSYLAVFGIVALQKPIFRLWYIRNKMIRKIWELLSITIAAQVATFPLCIYYFHQFPNLFLITNLFAVPMSTVLVYVELLLVMVSFLNPVAILVGRLLGYLIFLMNYLIKLFNSFSFSVWDNLYATALSTWLLYTMIFFISIWIIHKNRSMRKYVIISALLLTVFYVQANWRISYQKKIIIYNVPKHTAIDFMYRDKYLFFCDSILSKDGLLRNFHLKPSRISHKATKVLLDTTVIRHNNYAWQFLDKKIIIVDTVLNFEEVQQKIKIDILLLTNNSKTKIINLVSALEPFIIVFDASNSLWKIAGWKKECEQLALPFHSVPEKGAFVLDIN